MSKSLVKVLAVIAFFGGAFAAIAAADARDGTVGAAAEERVLPSLTPTQESFQLEVMCDKFDVYFVPRKEMDQQNADEVGERFSLSNDCRVSNR